MSQVRFGFGSGSGSNSDLEENSYRRVLVIGGVKVGKSSILSEAINGGFVYEYHATTHTDRFYDCTRQLEFIDTPGINDDKLNGLHSLQTNNGSIDQEKTPEILWDQLKLNFKSFREDIEIMELANDSMDRNNSVRSAFEIPYDSYDAILLVYTDDDRSKRLAKALRHVFLSKSFKSGFKPIYFLHNTGDIERRPLPNMLHMTDELAAFQTELNDKATGLIYRDDLALHTKFYAAAGLHFLPTVSAETGHQLALVFNQLARELHHIRKRHPIQSTKTVTRNGCNIPNVVGTVCDIQ